MGIGGLRGWFESRRLRNELSRWKQENFFCKSCDGLGEIEMFVDPGFVTLGWVRCFVCGGTGEQPDAPPIPPRFKEVM